MRLEKESPAANGAKKNIFTSKSINCSNRKQAHSFSEINALALSALPALVARWLPGGVLRGQEYSVRNPKRADRKLGSFSINVRNGRWSDFATGDAGGDIISLAAYLFNLSQSAAKRFIADMLGVRNV